MNEDPRAFLAVFLLCILILMVYSLTTGMRNF